MDLRTTSSPLVMRHSTERRSLQLFVSLLVCWASRITFAAAASTGLETFDGIGRARLPDFQCGGSGWSIEQTNEGNRAIATCSSRCSHNTTVLEGAVSTFGTTTVSFNYALNVRDATSLQQRPVLKVFCQTCYAFQAWSSEASDPSNGDWVTAEVRVKPLRSTFALILEANLEESGQVIGVDNVMVKDGKKQVPPSPTIPLEHPSNCFLEDWISTDMPTDGDESAFQSTDETASYPSDVSPENTFGLLDNETTLLLAQILAILSVSVCFITVGIHCFIWRKQRRMNQSTSIVPLRSKPTSDEPHDSMLLEMDLVASDEPDQPCSNSLGEPTSSKYLQQLQDSDILLQPDPRRATVSHGSSSTARSPAVQADEEDDSDDDQQRPHPRTKSLPCRPPVNVYESIDEVSKYQPLTFGKRPAPGPPGLPKGKRLQTRSKGVQNLAAVKKYRPSSVQYEEVGNRKNGLLQLDEPRDRSKSASHYDYVKRKSVTQSPRRNGWKYGQAQRPKGRAPAPPTRPLYDEPVRRSRPVVKVDSAPTLLQQNQESSAGEGLQTDYENTLEKPKVTYDRPRTINENIAEKPTGNSQYFTLEPPVGRYATSEDSDDERESERDISRFEDAEEEIIPNGTTAISLRPLSVSAPINIPPSKPNKMADFDEESSRL
ncbi:uncharacterized protein LOC110980459 [Acanthaster planci]|uniref:Uncharacterized protein LOC110980459 n=1 Tax=Acanthaster planci TaxID=133434 RepID=A0A8B7YHW6_ACAPL|nr:uncharacterized protein LOC110980459 [Acanthaster planci]